MATKKTITSKSTSLTPKKRTVNSRKNVEKNSLHSSHSVDVSPVESVETSRRLVIRRHFVIAVTAAVIVLAILYSVRGLFVAAIVNGQPISRWSVIHSLEEQGGKQALDSIITDTVIQQEAAKRHISVSQTDVDTQIKTIEENLSKQGETLDAALQAQGMTQQDLNDRIKIQVLVQKMVPPVTISDADAKNYMDNNKDSVPPGSSLASVKQQLQDQKLQTEEQAFVDNIKNKAKVAYWVNY